MFARTQRLALRPGWAEDAEALAATIGAPEIARNLLRVPSPYGLAEARDYLARPHNPRLPDFLAFARTGAAPRLIGGCGITRNEDGVAELGFWIARPFWGLGFATEAAGAVMQSARAAGIGPVVARHVIDNAASGHVLHKIGFRPTGQFESRRSLARGEDVSCVLYEDDAMSAGADTRWREDPSLELYLDRAPIAA